MSHTASESAVGRHPLIECRLDLLDRLLVGVVPRSARLAAVAQAEACLAGKLAELGTDAPTDAQVLQILSQVDPPETTLALTHARCTADGTLNVAGVGQMATEWFAPRGRPVSRKAITACVLGVAALGLMLACPMFFLSMEMLADLGEPLVYAILGTVLALLALCSAAAIVQSLYAFWSLRRSRGAETGYLWATVGLTLAVVPATASGLVTTAVLGLFLTNDAGAVTPPTLGMSNTVTLTETIDPVTGQLVLQGPGAQIGVDFDLNVARPSPPVRSPATTVVQGTGSTGNPASGTVQQASYTIAAPIPAGLELPPEPAPAHVPTTPLHTGPLAADPCEGGVMGWLLPLVAQPTIAAPESRFADQLSLVPPATTVADDADCAAHDGEAVDLEIE